MKVELKTHNTFGMALYKPSKSKVTKKIGLHAAEQLDLATPKLEELAKDVDIKVSIIKAKDFASKGFKITISEIVNPVEKLFVTYKQAVTQVMMGEVLGRKAKLSELLPLRTAQLKQKHFPQ